MHLHVHIHANIVTHAHTHTNSHTDRDVSEYTWILKFRALFSPTLTPYQQSGTAYLILYLSTDDAQLMT